MAEKSRRRLMLEESLREDPNDSFLRYGLALQCLSDGDVEEGRERLRELIADGPEEQIAAYHQLGRSFAESDEPEEAAKILKVGVAKALAKGDRHAAAEMEELLDTLE